MTDTQGNALPLRNANSGALFTGGEWTDLGSWLGVTARELQVLEAVCDDLKDCAIAERLAISTHTVRTHLERLFRKLGANSRAGLVVCVCKTHRRRAGTAF